MRAFRSAARIIVRTLGELCITAGLFLGLFLVWQLWWTDVVAIREQAKEVAALVEVFESAPPSEDTRISIPIEGETFAVIHIPRFGEDYARPIISGTGRDILALGVGHYPDSVMPGEIGNFSVAGHRTTYGAPFNLIAELQPGDPIIVETNAAFHVYEADHNRIVYPSQTEVVAPVPGEPGEVPTEAWMTMTSCHPMWSARQRFILHSRHIETIPRSETTLDELLERY